MAKQLHHQPDGSQSGNIEIEPSRVRASESTVGLLGGEALVRMTENSTAALEDVDAAGLEDEVLPVLVVGTGKPLDYEAALAVHKAIRSIGLGAARMPSTDDE